MGDAGHVFVLHGRLIGPAAGPVRAQSHESSLRYRTVARLPGPHVVHGDSVIRIHGNLGRHVDDHERQEHLLDVDRIHSA